MEKIEQIRQYHCACDGKGSWEKWAKTLSPLFALTRKHDVFSVQVVVNPYVIPIIVNVADGCVVEGVYKALLPSGLIVDFG